MIDQTLPIPSLFFNCGNKELVRLTTVLQSGFLAVAIEGDTIFSFLLTLDGFTEDYLINEVQTIFYNGDALDDLESEIAGPKATVALAAAMPGLAGAIMKKGSPCGALRKTRNIQQVKHKGEPVEILVKLFNTVARDRGPQLFSTGIRMNSRDLVLFLELRPTLVDAFEDIIFDSAEIQTSDFIASISKFEQLNIEVH